MSESPLESLLPKNLRSENSSVPFMLPATKVKEILAELGISTRELLVGAVALCESGNIFMGVNMEFPGLGLGFSVHGEQFLITRLAQNGEKVVEMAVNEVPCGHCRQFLKEALVSYYRMDLDQGMSEVVAKLTNRDLLDNVPHNLLDEIDLKLKLKDSEEATELSALAVQGANKSYTIYTECPSGAACKTTSGKTYIGSYYESAAYNPSLSPLHTMMISLWADGGNWTDVSEVVLVEKEDAVVSHAPFAKAMQEKVFTNAEMRIQYLASH